MLKDVPREAAIVKAIVSRIRAEYHGALVLKYHGGPHSVAGHPDLYGAVYSRAFALEVKRPGGRPTALQSARLDEWRRGGAITGVVTSADEAVGVIRAGLRAEVAELDSADEIPYGY